MVYTGKPSTGCENCRKSKKNCDGQLPCARCARLGKVCGGYRDVTELIFRDQSESVSRRAGHVPETIASSSRTPPRPLSLSREDTAHGFFFTHFVTECVLASLVDIKVDEFLSRPVLACSMAVLANRRGGDARGSELARQYYVDAIAATNTALRHPQRVKEDSTLIAVFLLGIFERVNWEGLHSSKNWVQHVKGTSMCLQLRGSDQLRTKRGVALFRDLRTDIIGNALVAETSAPEYIAQWSQQLRYDSVQSRADEITVLSCRIASARESILNRTRSDEELLEVVNTLEYDMIRWAEVTLASGSASSFHDVDDPDGVHAWSGIRHEYGMPQAYRNWNAYRSLRILISRAQESLWRRSWPDLVRPTRPIPSTDYYKNTRDRMVADLCTAAAYAFGTDNSDDAPAGSVSSALLITKSWRQQDPDSQSPDAHGCVEQYFRPACMAD